MTGDKMELPPEARARLDAYLDAVEAALRKGGAGRDEARSICDDVETQALDMTAARAAGRAATLADVEAVLAQLDPPGAYAQGTEPRAGAREPAAPAPPAPPPPAGQKFCWTAAIALLGLIPVICFIPILMLVVPFYAARTEAPVLVQHMETAPIEPGEMQPLKPPQGERQEGAPISAATHLKTLFGPMLCFGTIPLIGALWTTIFGIVAIVQIRRSKGQLRGMGLAIFDVVVFPATVVLLLVAAS